MYFSDYDAPLGQVPDDPAGVSGVDPSALSLPPERGSPAACESARLSEEKPTCGAVEYCPEPCYSGAPTNTLMTSAQRWLLEKDPWGANPVWGE